MSFYMHSCSKITIHALPPLKQSNQHTGTVRDDSKLYVSPVNSVDKVGVEDVLFGVKVDGLVLRDVNVTRGVLLTLLFLLANFVFLGV